MAESEAIINHPKAWTPTVVRDRMIPIGERALKWIEKYQVEARPSLTMPDDEDTLFLTNLSQAFIANRLTQMVREYID